MLEELSCIHSNVSLMLTHILIWTWLPFISYSYVIYFYLKKYIYLL